MKSREFVRFLLSMGWYIVRQTGSHLILRHKEHNEQITVPMHGAREVGKGLQRKILKQATKMKQSPNEEN
ncbi:MAG: type II toxin-antitoxin system HicA family toxin [Bacteroidia bacterium]|nr:type II toxin-antitoxin system HicA family toxin [Bacteroidia bacterium]